MIGLCWDVRYLLLLWSRFHDFMNESSRATKMGPNINRGLSFRRPTMEEREAPRFILGHENEGASEFQSVIHAQLPSCFFCVLVLFTMT